MVTRYKELITLSTRRRKRKNKAAEVYRFTRRHPLLSFAVFMAIVVGGATERWLDVEHSTQGYLMISAFCLVFVVHTAVTIGYGAVYVVMGLHPLTGVMSILYVGLTTQRPYYDSKGVKRWPRIEQHLFGSEYYGSAAKPWADTVVRWGFAHESDYFPRALLEFLEVRNIKGRKPLYNDLHNRSNPYRIDKRTALAQRAARNVGTCTPEYRAATQANRPLLMQS